MSSEIEADQSKMASSVEKVHGKKPDDNGDGRRQTTLACHDTSQHTAKCRGGKLRRIY